MTGLVTGSMAPDFEYFIRMNGTSIYSHTWAGIFYFDLPLTILLAFLFHSVVRNILIDHLPVFLAGRLQSFKDFNWTTYFTQNILVVLFSIIAGVATHLVLDGFTHAHGTFVEIFTILKKHVSISGHHIPLFILMQYFGTIFGGLLVIYALMQLPVENPHVEQRPLFPFWIFVTAITSFVVTMKIFAGRFPGHFDDRVVIAVSGGLIGLLLASVLFRKNNYRSEMA